MRNSKLYLVRICLTMFLATVVSGIALANEKDMKKANSRSPNCYKCQLENADFKGRKFFMANFQQANLKGASFDGAKLKGSRFIKADLTGASFKGADLTKVNFEGANLTKADLTGAKFNQTNVRLATLTGTKGLPIPDPVPDPPHGRCSGKNICGLPMAKQQAAATSAKSTKANDRGGPNKRFLGAEMYVVAGGSPMAGGFSVHQIVDALGEAKKTWKSVGKGQWMVTMNKTDQMFGKRLIMKLLFARLQASEGDGVLLKRIIANGQEFNQGQIFQLAQQLAFKAEAKQ